jgi:hypothetical protein
LGLDRISEDLMDMVVSFQNGELPLFHIYYGTIILLPKKENVIVSKSFLK